MTLLPQNGWLDHMIFAFLPFFPAPCVRNVQLAIEHIFPIVYGYRMNINEAKKIDSTPQGMHLMPRNRMQGAKKSKPTQRVVESDDESLDGSSDEDFDSDESQD